MVLQDGGSIGTNRWSDGDTPDGGQGQPVEGINCGLMDETYHVHAQLSIFLDGEQLAIPSEIGIVNAETPQQCTYALHTHDRIGKIHIEAPQPTRFTLGQFFAIWGQPLSRTEVAGLRDRPIEFYLRDGDIVTRFDGDPREIELTSHLGITVQVGSPIAAIPNYTWDGD